MDPFDSSTLGSPPQRVGLGGLTTPAAGSGIFPSPPPTAGRATARQAMPPQTGLGGTTTPPPGEPNPETLAMFQQLLAALGMSSPTGNSAGGALPQSQLPQDAMSKLASMGFFQGPTGSTTPGAPKLPDDLMLRVLQSQGLR